MLYHPFSFSAASSRANRRSASGCAMDPLPHAALGIDVGNVLVKKQRMHTPSAVGPCGSSIIQWCGNWVASHCAWVFITTPADEKVLS